MTFELTCYPEGWSERCAALEEAQQRAQSVAEGGLRWSASGNASWEATDPLTQCIYLIEVLVADT